MSREQERNSAGPGNSWGACSAYHALSDRFALPTYTQPMGAAPDEPCRTNTALLCTRRPRRLHTQSRSSSRGKVEASHHWDLKVMVPADCMTRNLAVSIGSVVIHAKMVPILKPLEGNVLWAHHGYR